MKKNRLFSGIIHAGGLVIILLFLAGCSSDDGSFWVMDSRYPDPENNSEAWYRISADKVIDEGKVKVYLDSSEDVPMADLQKLADEFNNTIYPVVTGNFAEPLDIDGNRKLTIVVLDLRDNYSTTGAYIGGYFLLLDMFSQRDVSELFPAAKSNEGDIIYIDCNPLDITAREAWSTAAHEFQHLVNFSETLRKNRSITDTWIDEGMAEAASHMCYGEQTDRIDFFNDNFSNYISRGQSLFIWQEDPYKNLVNYSMVYLFFQFLRSQSSSGNQIFKEILNTSRSIVDFHAIEDALGNDGNFSANSAWGGTDDERFERLLLRWWAANANGMNQSGLYGYDDEIVTAPGIPLYMQGSADLYGGGGVVAQITGSFTDISADYIYLSVSSDGASEDFDETDGFTDYDFLVAVNPSYSLEEANPSTTALPSVSQIITRSSGTAEEGLTVITGPVRVDKSLNPEVGNMLLEAARKK